MGSPVACILMFPFYSSPRSEDEKGRISNGVIRRSTSCSSKDFPSNHARNRSISLSIHQIQLVQCTIILTSPPGNIDVDFGHMREFLKTRKGEWKRKVMTADYVMFISQVSMRMADALSEIRTACWSICKLPINP
jgi:hypothetical protein